jgi:hypothetical protein
VNRIVTNLALLFALAPGAAALAQTPGPCPINYSRLEMPYKHDGGISTPTVVVSFVNQTGKKIVQAKFGLSILISQGNEVPYDQALTFTAGAEPGKLTNAKWELEMEKVSMEKIGETLYLKSARFEDGTTWKDDGNQRCRDEVNYGPR